ncbi:MAG TPA: YncE family protein [Candidatus Binatia bacterium]|nr:YncE family protein [Candidatus Binatia bacterium]
MRVCCRAVRAAALAAALLAFTGAAARNQPAHLATGRIATTSWPYLPGSLIPLRVNGFNPPYYSVLLGPGSLSSDGSYEIPSGASGTAFLVAGNTTGLAATKLRIAPPPPLDRPLLVVASYDDGLIFHDGLDFAVRGVLATGGTPADAAVDRSGKIAAADTQGSSLTLATLASWSVTRVDGVVLGDEIAIDSTTQAVFVTDRDSNGSGALTRVDAAGSVARVATGATAEGLAIDERRGLVYVANANDGTIAVVDGRSMRVLRRFHAVDRIFSLALSPDGNRLYGVSNESTGSPFGAAGSAVAIALRGPSPRIVARSPDLDFPLGVALDPRTATLFVTDESRNVVDVLDAGTLRPRRAPLRTCATPWKPTLDPESERLYVPCAGSNAIDAFDLRTLRRVPRAPFATGSYPLAVAIWHPR